MISWAHSTGQCKGPRCASAGSRIARHRQDEEDAPGLTAELAEGDRARAHAPRAARTRASVLDSLAALVLLRIDRRPRRAARLGLDWQRGPQRLSSAEPGSSHSHTSAADPSTLDLLAEADAQDEYERREDNASAPDGIVCQAEGQGLLVTA